STRSRRSLNRTWFIWGAYPTPLAFGSKFRKLTPNSRVRSGDELAQLRCLPAAGSLTSVHSVQRCLTLCTPVRKGTCSPAVLGASSLFGALPQALQRRGPRPQAAGKDGVKQFAPKERKSRGLHCVNGPRALKRVLR